jgi:hypothetical protein
VSHRKGSGIQPRPSTGAPKTKQVRVPIKKKTAENMIRMNQVVDQKRAEYQEAMTNAYNHCLPILTEHGYEKAKVLGVSSEAPYELVLELPK